MNICTKLTEEEYREYLKKIHLDMTTDEIEAVITTLKNKKIWGKNGKRNNGKTR